VSILVRKKLGNLNRRNQTRSLIDRVLFSNLAGGANLPGLVEQPRREAAREGQASPRPEGIKASARTALEPYSRTALPNGLRLLIKEDHFAPIVAVAIWVGAGAADDPPGKNGLSHFFEHMFFKGTETRGVGQMDREIKALGGYNNAATSFDFTSYYVVLPSDHYTDAIDIISDALLHSTFLPDEVENERQVILEEIRRQEDSPLEKLSTLFFEALFQGTPYADPILGRTESLLRITPSDFPDHFQKRYGADNLVLVVVGDVDTDRVTSQAERIFGSLDAASGPSPRAFSVEPAHSPREFLIERDVEQTYIAFGFAVPDVVGTVDEHALDVAAGILGEGRSSRFYQILIEDRGLVSFIDCGFSAFKRAGLFGIDAALDGKDVAQVRSVILEEIARLEEGKFADREMERAKTLITTDFAMSNEKVSSISGTLGLYEMMSGVQAAVEYCDRIRRVTRDEIRAAVREYLPLQGYTLGTLKPKVA
jgi:zinc protease